MCCPPSSAAPAATPRRASYAHSLSFIRPLTKLCLPPNPFFFSLLLPQSNYAPSALRPNTGPAMASNFPPAAFSMAHANKEIAAVPRSEERPHSLGYHPTVPPRKPFMPPSNNAVAPMHEGAGGTHGYTFDGGGGGSKQHRREPQPARVSIPASALTPARTGVSYTHKLLSQPWTVFLLIALAVYGQYRMNLMFWKRVGARFSFFLFALLLSLSLLLLPAAASSCCGCGCGCGCGSFPFPVPFPVSHRSPLETGAVMAVMAVRPSGCYTRADSVVNE